LPVKIRLRRMGAKHQPSYRIVVADSRAPRNGRYLDQVGFYNPLTNPATITVNSEKAIDWLRRGAQPTDTVRILLAKFNIEPSAVRKGHTPEAVEDAPQPSPRTSNREAAAAASDAATAAAAAASATAVAEAPAQSANPDDVVAQEAGETTIELAPDEAAQIEESAE
jgi:small subunit ribosomal protein S16